MLATARVGIRPFIIIIIIIIITIIIIIELTHSKNILENTVEIELNPVALVSKVSSELVPFLL